MEFIEEHGGKARQIRIIHRHTGENAFGDHENAGFRARLALETRAQAHRLAQGLTQQARHARGGPARGDAPRFEHEDGAISAPRRIEQVERHARRLARTGRRDEQRAVSRG